eukprot:PhM_4_TR15924/c3_g5_i3/m.54464
MALRGTEAAPATPAPFEVWYLDDGVFAAPAGEAMARFGVVRERLRVIGLAVNVRKCEAIALDGAAQQAGELPWTSLEAAELLGVPCGLQTAAASEKVLATVVRHLSLLERVAAYDPHAAFTLARHCGGFAAANYLLRALGPSTTSPELGVPLEHLRRVDDGVVSFVGSLVGALSPQQVRQIFLPARRGGLGFRSLASSAHCAHVAALLGAAPLVRHVLAHPDAADLKVAAVSFFTRSNSTFPPCALDMASERAVEDVPRRGLQRDFNRVLDSEAAAELNVIVATAPDAPRSRARIAACTATGASTYLSTPHLTGAWLAARQFVVSLQLRLGLAVGTLGMPCLQCGTPMDAYGAHALTCMRGGVRHHSHNAVRDYVYTHAARGLMQPLREHMCFPNGQERMDIVLRTGFGGKHALLDVAVTFPLRDEALEHPGPGEAANRYQERKWRAYGAKLDRATQTFVPVVVDTFGGFGDQCRETLSRVASAVARREPGDFSSVRAAFFGGLNATLLSAVADLVLGALRQQR